MKKQILMAATIVLLAACGGEQQHAPAPEAPAPPAKAEIEVPADINVLLNKHTCLTCHAAGEKVVGPAYAEVAKRNYTSEEIVELIKTPKPEHWPDFPPMIGLPKVPKEDALKIADWINSLK
jgi:cytochrome c551/c552